MDRLITVFRVAATFVMFAHGGSVTLGAHRLYTHRAMKATLPLRVILVLLQTFSGQVSITTTEVRCFFFNLKVQLGQDLSNPTV